MSKLGKHIYEQGFDGINNIDLNYIVVDDSVILVGSTGATGASIEEIYIDVSSITNWANVRDVLTVNTNFVINEIDILFQALGGISHFDTLTQTEKEALSKSFLIPKAQRDILFTIEEQESHASELYIAIDNDFRVDLINSSSTLIATTENTNDTQLILNNSANFQSSGGGSVSSINGESGIVILNIDDLADVNTTGVTSKHMLTFSGSNWVSELRPEFKVHTESQNYLNYNKETGELFVERLLVRDVTVNNTATSSSIYFNTPSCCESHERGDTIIFTNTTNGTEVWMHIGGSTLTINDYLMIENPQVSESFTRELFSNTLPITYDESTGIIGITQSTSIKDGYLSSTDWNTFNDKVSSVNGKFGEVILTTSNIVEGTNKYYCKDKAYLDFLGGTGINYNNTIGEFSANIDDLGSVSPTKLWSSEKILSTIAISGDITGVTAGAGLSGGGIFGEIEINVELTTNGGLTFSTSGDVGTLQADYISLSSNLAGNGLVKNGSTIDVNTGSGIVMVNDTLTSPVESLAQTLLAGNNTGTSSIVMGDNTVIKATNGGGQLDLRNSSNGVVALTNDNGLHNSGVVYLEDGYSALVADGWYTAYEVRRQTVGLHNYMIDMFTTHGMISIIDDPTGVSNMQLSGLHIIDTSLGTFSTSENTLHKINALLASPSSSVNMGVKNSVALGGNSMRLRTDNTAYVTQIGYSNIGTSEFETLLQFTPPTTANRTQTFQDKNGVIALLSDTGKKSWSWGAASNGDTTNKHLYKQGNTPTNISPFVVFRNSKIVNMSASNNVADTWIAEARVNGVIVATMSISGTNSAYTDLDVTVNAGDKISLYCKGTLIDSPSIEILLQEI